MNPPPAKLRDPDDHPPTADTLYRKGQTLKQRVNPSSQVNIGEPARQFRNNCCTITLQMSNSNAVLVNYSFYFVTHMQQVCTFVTGQTSDMFCFWDTWARCIRTDARSIMEGSVDARDSQGGGGVAYAVVIDRFRRNESAPLRMPGWNNLHHSPRERVWLTNIVRHLKLDDYRSMKPMVDPVQRARMASRFDTAPLIPIAGARQCGMADPNSHVEDHVFSPTTTHQQEEI